MKNTKIKDVAELLIEITDGDLQEKEGGNKIGAFVPLLAQKRLLGKEKQIIKEYRKQYNKKYGIVEATITLAKPLSAELQTELSQALKIKHDAKEVILLEKIDPTIIGGMRIQVEDMVYDTSIKNTLHQLETSISE